MKTFVAALFGSILGTATVVLGLLFLLSWGLSGSTPAAAEVGPSAQQAARAIPSPDPAPTQPQVALQEGRHGQGDALRIPGARRAGSRHERGRRAELGSPDAAAPAFSAGAFQSDLGLVAIDDGLHGDHGLEEEVLEGPITKQVDFAGNLIFQGQQAQREDGTWVRHGVWNAWHPNGVEHERGAYRDGAEDGTWDWWYEDGTPMSRGAFREGQRTGEWTFWHPGGERMMHGQYDANGHATGTWTYYHENGRKASEGPMVADEPEGRWTSWNPDGSVNLERSGVYSRGDLLSR